MGDETWWNNALAGNRGPVSEGHPEPGLYRTNAGRFAYWYDSHTGELRCQINGRDVKKIEDGVDQWIWACKHPVSREDYAFHAKHRRWPDEAEAIIGHNRAPLVDTLEAIADRIDDLSRQAEEIIKAGAAQNQNAVDQASDWANTFGELEKKADALRTQEKQPHLDECRAIDTKWRKLIDRAADLKSRLKRLVVTPFLAAEEKRLAAAAAAAIAKGADPTTVETGVTAGSTKRTTAMRTHFKAVIEDWDKLIAELIDHPEIRATAQRIADASARAGVALAGTSIKKERVAT